MIDKNVLSQIKLINTEIKDLRERLKKIETKKQKNVQDSVRGSSTTYPYIQHTCIVSGIENNLRDNKAKNKYKKMIKRKEQKLGKLITQIEYQLNTVEDSEIRQILRFKYEDNMTNNEIAHTMNEKKEYKKDYTEDGIRMQLNRFFEKN